MSATSEVQDLVRKLSKTEGVEVEQGGSGHYIVRKDGKQVASFASTPSDHRWKKNTMADLKRSGVKLGERSFREVAKDRECFLADQLLARRYTVAQLTKMLRDAGEDITEAGVRQILYRLEKRGVIYRANNGRQGKEVEWRARSAVPDMPKSKPVDVSNVEELDPTPPGARPWHPSMGARPVAHAEVSSLIDLAAAKATVTITLEGDLESILEMLAPLVRRGTAKPEPAAPAAGNVKLHAAAAS